MATLKFTGFPDGARVSVDALQGAETAAATVVAWGRHHIRPTVSVNVQRASVPEARHAPEGVVFEAASSDFSYRDFGSSQTYDPAFHEVHYEWDFGDARAPWTAPRLPDEFNEPSKGYGKRVGHVFVEPGTYTVTCTARQIVSLDPLEVVSAQASTLVNVADPEDVFDAQRTLVVALDGDFTGAPAADFQASSTAAMRSQIEAFHDTPGAIFRVLLKRGEDYRNDADAKKALDWLNNRGDDNVWSVAHVGAWGDPSEAKPIVPALPAECPADAAITVKDLHFLGDYDPETGIVAHTGQVGEADGQDPVAPLGSARLYGSGWHTFVGVDITNVLTNISILHDNSQFLPGGDDWTHLYAFFDNCSFVGHDDYVVFGDDEARDFICFRGCALRDDPRQLSNPAPPQPKNHSGYRTLRYGDHYIDGCDFFARGGWSADTDWSDGAQVTAGQPCIRLNGNNLSRLLLANPQIDPFRETGSSYITRCVLEGPRDIITKSMTGKGPMILGNDVIERNLMIGGPRTETFIRVRSGGTTIRGNVMIKPDTSEFGLKSAFEFYAKEVTLQDPPIEVPLSVLEKEPLQIYSNTIAVLYDDDSMGKQDGAFDQWDRFPLYDTVETVGIYDGENGGPFLSTVLENNIVYAPNLPLVPDRVDYTANTTKLFDPRYLGRLLPTPDYDFDTVFAGEDRFLYEARNNDTDPNHATIEGIPVIQNPGDGSITWTAPAGTYTIVKTTRYGFTVETDVALDGSTDLFAGGETELRGYAAVGRALTGGEETDLVHYLASDHYNLNTFYATPTGTIAWYDPVVPADVPAASLPTAVSVFTIKGTHAGERSADTVPRQGAHTLPPLSPLSSVGAQTSVGPGGEDVHTFLDDGALTVTETATVFYELVGGGGGGGSIRGGGGGAGGVLTGSIELAPGEYTVTVGAGGITAIKGSGGTPGGDTFIALNGTDVARAIGGGVGGRSGATLEEESGGSGGGGGGNTSFAEQPGSGTAGQGNDGGTGAEANEGTADTSPAGAGGGGAGAVGETVTGQDGGAGGEGVASIVPGADLTLGGGGGGQGVTGGAGGIGGGGAGASTLEGLNEPGAPNTGGGAGGNANTTSSGGPGGSGRATIWWVPA